MLRGEKDVKCRIDVGLRGQDRLRCEATLLWVKQSLLESTADALLLAVCDIICIIAATFYGSYKDVAAAKRGLIVKTLNAVHRQSLERRSKKMVAKPPVEC